MASIDRSDPIILGHVLFEHQDLFHRITAARHAFACKERPGAESLASLTDCLRSLRDHLDGHFRKEEAGGFLEEAVTRMPRLGPAVAKVMSQHPTLLAELDKIISGLPSSTNSAEVWDQAGQSFEAFAANIMAHERSENAVVQEGYNEDLGLMD